MPMNPFLSMFLIEIYFPGFESWVFGPALATTNKFLLRLQLRPFPNSGSSSGSDLTLILASAPTKKVGASRLRLRLRNPAFTRKRNAKNDCESRGARGWTLLSESLLPGVLATKYCQDVRALWNFQSSYDCKRNIVAY